MIASVVSWIITNYILVLSIYVVGGAIYALLKWVLMLMKLRRSVSEIDEVQIANYRKAWSTHKDTPEDKLRYELRNRAANRIFGTVGSDNYPPTAKDNKGNLLMWAAFWPFNAIYTLFADVATEIWNFIYNFFASTLNAIARSILPN